MRSFTTWYVIVVCILVVGAGVIFVLGYCSSVPGEAHQTLESEYISSYPTQYVRERGVTLPPLVSGDNAELNDDEPVIGVVVAGQPRAYQKQAFVLEGTRHRPGQHVVNDLVDEQPVTIIHCDRTDCTRVFLGEPSQHPLNVGVMGWQSDRGMILDINGGLYPLESPDIPLKELDFERTTWEQWYRTHPSTKVYLDPDSEPVTGD